jgi:hypothetical protein
VEKIMLEKLKALLPLTHENHREIVKVLREIRDSGAVPGTCLEDSRLSDSMSAETICRYIKEARIALGGVEEIAKTLSGKGQCVSGFEVKHAKWKHIQSGRIVETIGTINFLDSGSRIYEKSGSSWFVDVWKFNFVEVE